jgi:peptidyl-prolyl cis-trans isomerase SurA
MDIIFHRAQSIIKFYIFVLNPLGMNRILLATFFILIFNLSNLAIAQDETLFTVGDTKVKKSEFEYIYKKNNFNNKADFSKKSLEDYLNLYINFRLKVKEAIAQGLDTTPIFKAELDKYQQQLLDSYLDKEVLQKLIKQEYERSQKDVNISHVFFKSNNENDIATAKLKCEAAAKKINEGIPFSELVSSSEDNKSKNHNGNLGWFNSYQIALPEIEEAVYALQTGQISAPVKTKLGYHIIRLNETRPARQMIKVAIIKQYFPLNDTSAITMKIVEDSMQAAYKKLMAKTPFENVVEQYSQDDESAANKGVLGWFGINKYASVFEDAAYALKDGEFSKPFRTASAWYIVKRMETAKPTTYETSIATLKTKLVSLPIYQYELDKFLDKLKLKYAIQLNEEAMQSFKFRLDELSKNMPFTYRDTMTPKTILKIGKRDFTENDFGKNIQTKYYAVFSKSGDDKSTFLIKNTVQQFILDYYKNEIRATNEEYNALMNEYRNGIMIFTLSENNIWNKASEDTTGLRSFYNENTSNFDLKNRAKVRIFSVDNPFSAKKIIQILKKQSSNTDDSISTMIKNVGVKDFTLNSSVLDETKTNLNISQSSISEPVLQNNKYVITQVLQPQQARKTTFAESKGYVVAAYQEYLENKWLEVLKLKYPIKLNNSVFDSLVKKP